MTNAKGPVSQEAAIAVLAILGAKDHYAAMDASRDASVAELRRAYLKASVLVHPDKNQHPQATRAFQRVAAAWAVLSDPQKRRDYDQELQEGDQNDEIQLSPEEAFAAFAFAAACAGGGAGFGDMAETLFWAQQLGLSRPMASCPGIAGLAGCGGGVGGGSNDAVQATTQGLCLSLGLYSAGLVISFLGLPRIGSFARRMALVQGVSQVVIASQVPAVRMACHTASMQAQEALGNFASQHPDWTSVATRLQNDGQNLCRNVCARSVEAAKSLKQIMDDMDFHQATEKVRGAAVEGAAGLQKVREVFELEDSWSMRSCLGWKEDSDEEDDWYVQNLRLRKQRESWKPRCGSWVRLSNLQRARHLEGCLGEVMAYNRDSGRYLVQLLPPSKGSGPGPIFQGGTEVPPISKLVLLQNLRPAVERTLKPPLKEANFI
mgnify:CR=1 FL=1